MAADAPAPPPAGLLGAVVNPPVALTLVIANKFWDPIADYIGYPCDRKRRIDDHKQAVQRVIAMRDDFLLIGPCPPSLQSRHWLKCVKQLEEEYTKIQLSYLNGGYLNTCSCAREAMKETKRAEDLGSQFKELTIDTKARSLPVKGSKRKEDASLVINSYKDLVIKFINDTSGEARMLGIWGMAGIGKSTLLRQVSKCCSEFLPDADDLLLLLFVDIGLDCSIDKVQKSLLGLLGITVPPDVTEAGVALPICNRLLGMRFLIMFDGLSSPINLSRVGIPDPPPTDLLPLIARCHKVVFTTQKESVCASMGCNKTIQIICPSAIDVEKLFNHAVGENIMKDPRIASLAPMIINECVRLPEALWKVGRSLSIKDTPKEWEVALKLMRQSKLSMVTYQSDDLIDRFRRNYNDLEENMKECFLVCSLWCQEEDIAIKDLVQWWRAMDLLDTFNGHAEGYAYVRLQQLALLERGENSVTSSEDTHVRMNAMMHKVAK